MEKNMTLTFGFEGGASFNAVGQHVHTLPAYLGGFISHAAGNNGLTAKYGYAVSADNTNPGQFLNGIQSYPFVGVIAFDPSMAENQPAMPDYFVQGLPCTICYYGPVWYKTWTKTTTNAIDPTPGCLVVTENATGQIQFVPAVDYASIQAGWTLLPATVITVDNNTNGALIWMNAVQSAAPAVASYIVDNHGNELASLPFASSADNAIDFEYRTVGTSSTVGSLISSGATWLVHAAAGGCAIKLLTSSSATTGEYDCLRLRARADASNPTGSVVCGNFSASANTANYGSLYAVQGYVQPNGFANNTAAGILCALYGKTVNSSTGVYAGRSWTLWVDSGDTNLAASSHYLARFSHNGGAINLNGLFTFYLGQGCDYLFNFENTAAPLTSGDKTALAKTYSIAVNTLLGIKYIQLYDHA